MSIFIAYQANIKFSEGKNTYIKKKKHILLYNSYRNCSEVRKVEPGKSFIGHRYMKNVTHGSS